MAKRKPRPPIRELAHLFSICHNITYYAEELAVFQEHGIDEYWHGYLAYCSAPMGATSPSTVCSTFYNFAPTLVSAAIPSVWETITPADAIRLRDDAIASALGRIFTEADADRDASARRAADATIASLVDQSVSGRPLFGAHLDLPVPDEPIMRLWHAATLWREHRGDGHNIALAAASIDGIECHVLLAGRGIANQKIIETIRGWSAENWSAAHERLLERGLLNADGTMTDAGRDLRRDIELTTDRLAQGSMDALGEAGAAELIATLQPLVQTIIDSGIVPDRWPPPKPSKII